MNQYIVVQVPVSYYEQIFDCYNGYENLIFSTLKKEDGSDIKALNKLRERFHVVVSPFNFNPGTGNLNCQSKTSYEGIKLAKSIGATHVLKIRSDMIISDVNKFMEILSHKDKLSFLAWHHHDMLLNYNYKGSLIDYVNYGCVDDILNFWNIFSVNCDYAEKNLMDNFRNITRDSLTTFSDIIKYVDFFMKELKENKIDIKWLKYNLNISEYYKHSCYLY